MRRVASFSITTALVAFTVLASGQSPAPQVAQASKPAVSKTHDRPTLSKTESDAVVAAIKPAYAAFKTDRNEKKFVAAASALNGESRWVAMGLVATAIERTRSLTPQALTRYAIESATLDKIKAGKLPDCELTVEMTLRVRRTGVVPQGTRVEVTGRVNEVLNWPTSTPSFVDVNAVFPSQDPNQPVVSVPLVVSKLPNKTMGQCKAPMFSGDLAIVGGVASPYRIRLSDGELTVEVPPPPPEPCPPLQVRCFLGNGSCVPEVTFPVGCIP